MKKNEKSYKGEIFVIISSVLFGLMPLLVKVIATHGGNACMTALGRFFIGSLILFTVISARRNISLQITLRQFREIALLSVFYALTPVLLFSSYTYMDSGLATTLHFTFPVLVIVFSVLLFRVCPDCRQIFCTLLCTVGISQLSGGEAAGVTGVLLAIASGVTYALYIVFLGKSSLQSVSALATVFWLTLLSSMEIALFAAATGNLIFPSDATAWGVTALLALLSTALALVLFQMGLFRCGPIRASLLSTFEPLTSVVVGSLVFYEMLTAQNLIGIFCVLGSGALLVLPASWFASVKQFLFATEIGKNEKSVKQGGSKSKLQEDDWNGFYKMCVIVFGRSIIFYGMNTFLALFCMQVLGGGNSILTLFYGVCALCTFFGGRLADRYGYKKIIRLSFLVIFPFILLLSQTTTLWLALLLIVPAGMAIGLCYSPIVVTGQNMLPSHKGLASGVTLGLAVSIGGIFAPLLGKIANTFGLSTAILAISCVSIVPLIFSFWLPGDAQS